MLARENPLATDRLSCIRYRFMRESQEQVWERLQQLEFRGAIVGPEGHGKTTLLEDLAESLRAAGFQIVNIRLTREQPRLAPGFVAEICRTLTNKHCILFDGAEQLGRIRWWNFKRRTRHVGGLIITSHRPGLLPTLIDCSTTPDLLRGITADLLPGRSLSNTALDNLFAKHHGNLREALRELYDLFAAGQHADIFADGPHCGIEFVGTGSQPVQRPRHE